MTALTGHRRATRERSTGNEPRRELAPAGSSSISLSVGEPRATAGQDRGAASRERLSLRQFSRIPTEDPTELVGREPAPELALRALFGALDERVPELAVQLPAARRPLDRLARPVVHAPILASRPARRRRLGARVLTAVAHLEASHP
jgi:hypothetical protein